MHSTYALARANGKEEAIIEAEKLNLENNQFYFTLLGELYKEIDHGKSKLNFQKALSLAKTKTDQQIIQTKIDNLNSYSH